MAIKLLIPGQRDAAAAAAPAARSGSSATDRAPATDLLDSVQVVDAFSLAAPARAQAAATAPAARDAREDDILEIEADGFTLWTSVERYRRDLAIFKPEAVRGDTVIVDTLPGPSAGVRGPGEWAASAMRLLRLGADRMAREAADPKVLAEFAQDLGLSAGVKAGAWLTTRLVVWLAERRLRPREGLYSWTEATRELSGEGPEPVPATFERFDARKPLLLFLHGTASNTRGSFGELLSGEAGADWRALADMFGEHIYAYEHRTLSRSPIENAIALAEQLPARANLSLVSHSRGGLIGDLLCLGTIGADQVSRFHRSGRLDEADRHDRAGLERLGALLAKKQFRVRRFARCACPSRGTLLASDNLDQFLSVLTNLVGLVPPLGASAAFDVVKRVTLETAKNRWKPELIPGIEAMIPSSPLVQLLNGAASGSSGALGVIAGDIEGGNWLQRLGVLITDRFLYEGHDNDLIVNTASMFQGAPRSSAHYVYDQGSDVSHFNYFKNGRTRSAVSRWIAARTEEIPAEFRELTDAAVEPIPIARSMQSRAGSAQPVVVLVPDLMGSHLSAGQKVVWPDRARLAEGAFGDLADPDRGGVNATALAGETYAPLCERLADSHEVIPWAYDWRRSMAGTAKLLRASIGATLARTRQPVRIVAHGAGGLIVRAAIAQDPALWDRLCKRDGARVVLLGTASRGAYDSVQLLLGTAAIAQQLALIDPARGPREVIEIFQRFPAVLETLPRTADHQFFLVKTWKTLKAQRFGAPPPAASRLSAAKAFADSLADEIPHADRIVYVAGTAERTVDGIDVREGQVALHVTTEGDGRVTYESGRLPGVLTWYADALHGDLASNDAAVPGIVELLEQGNTGKLSTVTPSDGRGGAAAGVVTAEPVLFPTASDLMTGALGRRRARPYRGRARGGFRVTVKHGDLRFARYPVVVGHYDGDTIIGAEGEIDRLLGGALTTRYNLGLYPGPLGTVTAVLRHTTEFQRELGLPNGAIVVGLGRWGELTSAQVGNLVRKAALQYVLQRDDTAETGVADRADGVGLTVLLIGTTSTNISIDDSVGAILRGVAQANQELDARVAATSTRITELEIVELFADAAIQAARAARRLARSIGDELKVRIDAAPLLQRGRHGRTRLTVSQGFDAWRRWEVTVAASPEHPDVRPRLPPALQELLKKSAAAASRTEAPVVDALVDLAFAAEASSRSPRELKFVSLSDRARAEVLHEQRQPELIDRLIQSSIARTAYKADHARTLFELMVPNDLKDGLGQLSRVVFVVDGETAQYPWELMNDGGERPLCTRLGLIRQLQTGRYRPHIRATTARTAYVVGDPLVSPPYRQLPGAEREARQVAELLQGAGFLPTVRADRPAALEVLSGLFMQPYRVLHLAGHGDYTPPTSGDPQARSGMVLDNGVVLTAAEVAKLPQVPELVFLNCCFIGQTGPDAPADNQPGIEYNRLAASVSRELIEMGVRAVVAAGWAVRDDAALLFATTFYREMLGGTSFGRAVQAARTATWEKYPDTNTWGAYQAYGDPEFRFDPTADGRSQPAPHVAAAELVDVLTRMRIAAQEIRERPGDAGSAARAAIDRLDALVKGTPGEWLAQSDVLMALGRTYGELAQWQPAIRHLREALDTNELDSATTIKAVEQLANFEARAGYRETRTATTDAARRRGLTAIRGAIARYHALLKVAPTAERHNMLGGAYKMLATAAEDVRQAREALQAGVAAYRAAHDHNTKRQVFDPYPVLNWLTLTVLLRGRAPDARGLLARAEAAARERFARPGDSFDAVFDAVALAEIELVRALVASSFTRPASERTRTIAAIVAAYQEALQRIHATPRQVDSVVRQLDLIERVLGRLGDRSRGFTRIRDAIRTIATGIGGETSQLAVTRRAASARRKKRRVRRRPQA